MMFSVTERAMKPKVQRSSQSFRSRKDQKKYWALLTICFILGLFASVGLLVYQNPVPVTSPSFIPVVRRRAVALVAMLIAAVAQSISTVAFQSTTNNRIITPSLLGFEALYSTINTATIFFFGSGSVSSIQRGPCLISLSNWSDDYHVAYVVWMAAQR